MIKMRVILLFILAFLVTATQGYAAPGSERLDSVGADRAAIDKLLSEYTAAVSTQDQQRFEVLLLNKSIPFSDADAAASANGAEHGTQNYEQFRKSVFEGPAFHQRFQNVRVQQAGALAQVSLVFINTTSTESSAGWKTMQLLKTGGQWKIVSEFFTGLD